MKIKLTLILGMIVYSTISAQIWTPYNTANTSTTISNSYANDVAIESGNIKWIATRFGVSRYDGSTWTNYTQKDGLLDNDVDIVSIDKSGNKWFGFYEGITFFDGTTWTSYDVSDGLVGKEVYCFAFDLDSTVWIGTRYGVSHFNGITWTNYTTNEGLIDNPTFCITIDANGSKWFATNKGISKFDGIIWTDYTNITGWTSNNIKDIAFDSKGNLWAGKSDGLTKFDGATWTNYFSDLGGLWIDCRSIRIDNSDKIWFGASIGLSTFDGLSWKKVSGQYGTVGDVEIDNIGTKWITNGFQFHKFDGITLTPFLVENGLPYNTINSLVIDAADNKWIGTNEGATYFDGTNWTTYNKTNGLPTNHVLSSAIDSSGTLWQGQWNGLSSYNGSSWTKYTSGSLGFGIAISGSAVVVDSLDQKWFGLEGGDSVIMINNTGEYHHPNIGIADFHDVTSAAVDVDGSVWIGTMAGLDTSYNPQGGGVSMWNGSFWTPLYDLNIMYSYIDVIDIVVDSKSNKWIATWNGLYKYDNTNLTQMSFDIYSALHVDANDALWAGHQNGVKKIVGNTWIEFTIPDYLQPTDVNSITSDASGDIWVGTRNGIIKLEDLTLSGQDNDTIYTAINPNNIDSIYFPQIDTCLLNYTAKLDTFYINNYSLSGTNMRFNWKFIQGVDTFTLITYKPLATIQQGQNLLYLTVSCNPKNTFVTPVDITTTKANENKKLASTLLYPNPTSQQFLVSFGRNVKRSKIEVFNIEGKLIKSIFQSNVNSVTVDIDGKSGTYVIKVFSDERQESFNVIKN